MIRNLCFSVRERLCSLGLLVFVAFTLPAGAQFPTNLNLSLVSNVKPSSNPISYGDVWAEGYLACLGVWLQYNTYNYGVGIYSISNPAAPVLLSVYNTSPLSQNQFEAGALRDRIGYFGSWSDGGTHIVSLTNPAAPQLLSRIGATTGTVTNGFDRVHTLFLERDFLYLAAHVVGVTSVKVFNVANPHAPVFLQNIVATNSTRVHQITVRNKGAQTLLYTSGWGNGTTASPGQTDIWDVTHVGSQPAQWLGRIISGYNSHSSWPTPDGNTLIVCRELSGGDVRIYDITDPGAIPTNAVPLVTLTPASMGLEADIPHNPVVVGDLLFLSWYQNGVQVFNISDRLNPVRVGFFDTYPAPRTQNFQGNWGVFPDLGFDKILLSDIQSGLWILDGTALLTPTNNYPPLLVRPPVSVTTTQGFSAAFTPAITGSQLRYQWRFNGSPLTGATNATLELDNVQTNQAGGYSVVATNTSGTVTSAVATLSVVVANGPPLIASPPQDVAVYPDTPATFTVGVVGAAPFSYQWQFNGDHLPGATNGSFTRELTVPEHVGFYRVVISNAFGTATSDEVLLTLLDSPYLNSVRAVAGARSALISWTTTVPSDSEVQFDPATVTIPSPSSVAAMAQSSFGQSSYIDTRPVTEHLILLTGLAPGTRYSFQVLSTESTNTYVSGVYQFTTAGTNIVENPDATFTGDWTVATSAAGRYSSNYAFANTVAGPPTATATFRPQLDTSGQYAVDVWYPQGGNRANNAPYTIVHHGGSVTVPVNQQTGGGAWQPIGAGLDFSAGTSGHVVLANNANPSVVIADAVRFRYVEAQDFPAGATVPAWWRDFFFATPPDPNGDDDADGYTNAEEYLIGTSPMDAASRLKVNAQADASAVRVTFWPYLSNRSYQLLVRTNLNDPTWESYEPASIQPTPYGHGIFTIPLADASRGFFRVRVQWDTNSAFSGSLPLAEGESVSAFASDPVCGPNRAFVQRARGRER